MQINEFVDQLTRSLPADKLQYVAAELQRREPVAVVGMGCRLPGGVSNAEEFWSRVRDGYDAVTSVPESRWNWRDYFDSERGVPGKAYTRWGAFVENVYDFEPAFFDMSPLDAKYLDPQQRLLMEVGWEALEDAGLTKEQLRGSATGVFFGVFSDDYFDLQHAGTYWAHPSAATGTQRSMAAGRMAHWLDLHGPALVLDTSCSSSLVAAHQACLSLRAMETDVAIVGGVQLYLSPREHIMTSRLGMCSPDGACRLLDAGANGFVHGEGCGVIVLKRLSAAVAARDRIYALIRGSAVNHDGQTLGLTAPNGAAQQAVIRAALRAAGVEPASVGYIEMHGTGTALGDPCEMDALQATYGVDPSAPVCSLGSAKTNIGHTAAAAGVCGMIRAIQSMRHAEVPPNSHLKRLNPRIQLEGTRFRCPTTVQPWQRDGSPRRSGVSAFGASGTNVHAILEEAESPPTSQQAARAAVIALSSRSREGMRLALSDYSRWLETTEESASDIAYTSCLRRTHWEHRVAVAAPNLAALRSALAKRLAGDAAAAFGKGKLGFAFSGASAACLIRAAPLLEADLGFREQIARLEAELVGLVPWSLTSVLTSGGAESNPADLSVAVVATQLALAARLTEACVEPAAISGDGFGVFAAAASAGLLTSSEALRMALACVGGNDQQRLVLLSARPEEGVSHPRGPLCANGGSVTPSASWGVEAWRAAANGGGEAIASSSHFRSNGVVTVVELDAAGGTRLAGPGVQWLELLAADLDPALSLTGAFAAAFECGGAPRWETLAWTQGKLISLPQSAWVKTALCAARKLTTEPRLAELSHGLVRQASEGDSCVRLQTRISIERFPYLAHHRVLGLPTLPGALYVELMQAACENSSARGLDDITFVESMVLTEGTELDLRCTVRDGSAVILEARPGLHWVTCATARVPGPHDPWLASPRDVSESKPSQTMSRDEFYAMWEEREGIGYGPAFRGIQDLRFREDWSEARVDLPAEVELGASMLQHPALLDACLQVTAGALLTRSGKLHGQLILAKSILATRWQALPTRSCTVRASLQSGTPGNEIVADLEIRDVTGTLIGTINGFRSVRAERAQADALDHHLDWVEISALEPSAADEPSPIAMGRGSLYATMLEFGARSPEGSLPSSGARVVLTLDESGALTESAQRGKRLCLELIRLLRALATELDDGELIVVTRSAQGAGSRAEIDPAQASLWGIVTSFQAEHGNLDCRLVDVDETVTAERLNAELERGRPERRIALRGHQRFALRLQRGNGRSSGKAEAPRVSERGYHLITGGLGHVGQVIGRELLARGDRVVLLSRRRGAGDDRAQTGFATDGFDRVSCDVTDVAALQEVLQRCESEFGSLKGVVHCAGVMSDASVDEMNEETFAAAWAPKAEGALALRAAIGRREPHFIVLCSSMNAVLAAEGQANTAAANCFLDALSLAWSDSGARVLSINWGAWGESPSLDAALTQRLAGLGVGTFSDREAIAAFKRLLDAGVPRASVMRFNAAKWVEARGEAEGALVESMIEVGAASRARQHADARLLALGPAEREADVFEQVAAALARLLMVDAGKLARETTLESLGLTSLSALELRSTLHRLFGVSLPATVVWRHPTIGALVDTLLDGLAPAPAGAVTRSLPPLPDAVATEATDSLSEGEVERLLEAEIEAGI